MSYKQFWCICEAVLHKVCFTDFLYMALHVYEEHVANNSCFRRYTCIIRLTLTGNGPADNIAEAVRDQARCMTQVSQPVVVQVCKLTLLE